MASNKVSWMTPGAGNNIRPNRHQLASIEYENATKNRLLPCGTKFPLAGTGTPWQGPVPLWEDGIPLGGDWYPSVGTSTPLGGPNSPRRGPVLLSGDRHYAMEDCWKTENPYNLP